MTQSPPEPLILQCEGRELLALLHRAQKSCGIGVVVVVGGPQYRIGSHRQFYHLARFLAEHGVSTLRFDYRGMGDSDGEQIDFEQCAPDIRSAVDALLEADSRLRRVYLWGLCDAASASLLYATADSRIDGLVLLNPWVRTEASYARTQLKHYYLQRLLQKEFWQKLASGGFDFKGSLVNLRQAVGRARNAGNVRAGRPSCEAGRSPRSQPAAPLPDRMLAALKSFGGQSLIVLSGNDLTAKEFEDLCRTSSGWRVQVRSRAVTIHRLASANHTFSDAGWRSQVETWTLEWLLGTAGSEGKP